MTSVNWDSVGSLVCYVIKMYITPWGTLWYTRCSNEWMNGWETDFEELLCGLGATTEVKYRKTKTVRLYKSTRALHSLLLLTVTPVKQDSDIHDNKCFRAAISWHSLLLTFLCFISRKQWSVEVLSLDDHQRQWEHQNAPRAPTQFQPSSHHWSHQ